MGMQGTRLRRNLGLETLEDRHLLTADLVISEFMASNDATLTDGFGDTSDWIELFNDGPGTIDLDGHYLTDDETDLTKWRMPAFDLASGSSIVIFASSQDTVLASGEMHTNFKLTSGGEYLGLVDTDGFTVLQDFGIEYPAQSEDISYGIAMSPNGQTRNLVSSGDTLRALEPANDALNTLWTEADFNDNSWPVNGPSPVGFETSPGEYAGLIQTNLTNNAASLYVRYEFVLTSLDDLSTLRLGMRYDDGFAAYINGQLVAEANTPDNLAWNSFATANHLDPEAVELEYFDASAGVSRLKLGQNVLAIHGLNVSATSSDLLFDAELVAEGATIDQPVVVGYQESATPGSTNGDSFAGFNSPVEFGIGHGFYDSPQSLPLTTANAGSTIVYTTDGSEPLVDESNTIVNGTLYTAPISVSQTSVVRAAAFKPDFRSTPSTTQSYLFLDDILQQQPNGEVPGPGWASGNVNGQEIDYGMDPQIINTFGSQAVKDALTSISTFSITTDVDNLFDSDTGIYVNAANGGRSWERPASIELIDSSGAEGFQINAGLRIRGGFSRGDFNPKHAFRFYFRGEYGASKLDYQLFEDGAESYNILDLRTAQNYSWSSGGDTQNTFLREVWSRDLQRDLGHEHTRSEYHHLYINGIYWGLFQTQERIHDFYGEQYLGGDESNYDVVKSGLRDVGGTEIADGNDEQWRELFDLGQALAQNPVANADNYFTMQGLHPDGTRDLSQPVLVDMENLMDYMLILFYTGNLDSGLSNFIGNNFANNWFGINDRTDPDQGFVFFAHDAEHSLGVNGTENVDRTGPFNEGNQNNYAQQNPQYLHQDLLVSEEYRLAFADRVYKHMFNGGELTPAKNIGRLQERRFTVQDAILAESVRWGDAQVEPPRDPSHWAAEVGSIFPYFNARESVVLNQLSGDGLIPDLDPPQFNQLGGSVAAGFPVELTADEGVILYTTDGSDPRLPGGTIRSTTIVYNGTPITINADTVVKARTLQSGEWSALAEGRFTLSAAAADGTNLRITELHFNPADPTTSELAVIPSLDNDDFEFLEIQNVGSETISLAGVTVDSGTPFALPAASLEPGDFALIVANQTAFELRYGSGLPIVAANNLSSFSNGGETITLSAANDSIIQSFTYDDIDNWPSFTDGHGESLVVIDTAGDYDDPLNWLPSRDIGGNPGSADPLLASPSPLRVTEIMYNPVVGTGSEFIELVNSGSTTIDVSNFRLIEGVEFEFSASTNTLVSPGEKLVLVTNLAEFNSVYGSVPAVVGTFASGSLGNGGERIILVDDAGDLVHDFVYDDEGLWPTLPDGGGRSLEVINTNGNYSDPLNWQASSVAGGTPGDNELAGDFNDDGQLDCADINALNTVVANGAGGTMFDVDGSGTVDVADVGYWVANLKGTSLGDANLDGLVDGVDFDVWSQHKFTTNANWCDGDFDADGAIGGHDFLIWNANRTTLAAATTKAKPNLPKAAPAAFASRYRGNQQSSQAMSPSTQQPIGVLQPAASTTTVRRFSAVHDSEWNHDADEKEAGRSDRLLDAIWIEDFWN